MKIEEVAAALRVGKRRVHTLATTGELKRIKIGRNTRFDVRDVERFIERCTEAN